MAHPGKDQLLRLWRSSRIVWCIASIPYLIGICACALKLSQVPDKVGNLHTFRTAAIALSHGQNIYRSGSGDYIYPPLIAFLCQPLGWISLHWAGVVMLSINLVVAIWTLKMISEELLLRWIGSALPLTIARVAMLSAWLSIDHIRTELNQWETNTFVLLAFVLGLRWADRHPVRAGIALGFGLNIKYLPIVLAPYLLVRRRWTMLSAFVCAAIVFAVLPSISMGWHQDFAAIRASNSGVASLLGIHLATAFSSDVTPLISEKSISLPSFVGRITGLTDNYVMMIAGLLVEAILFSWLYLYFHNGLPAIKWPPSRKQNQLPYRSLFALDWIGIILLALVFSPYTNSGHLYLLVAVNTAAAVLLLYAADSVYRWPLWIGAVMLFLGMILPPGGDRFRYAEQLWKRASVSGWCMYLFSFLLIWTAMDHIRITTQKNNRKNNTGREQSRSAH